MALFSPITLPPFIFENNDLFGLSLFHNVTCHSHISKCRLADLNRLVVGKHEYTIKGDRRAYLTRNLLNP